jgi:flagellin
MAFTIVSNVASLNAQRSLNKTQTGLNANMARLSSGLRINTAGDDAAGLAISEKLKAQIRSITQASRNANDGVSMLQTAEGAMNEVSGILTRMRELAVQSSTDTVGDTERGYLNTEFTQQIAEIDRIASVTEFNGVKLINGEKSTAGVSFQVGFANSSDDRITVNISSMVGSTNGLSVSAAVVSAKTSAQAALATIDAAIEKVSSGRATLGAAQNRLQVTISNLASAGENLSAANSRIRDVDVAEESSALTRNSILMQAGVAVLAQANQSPAMALKLLG